MVGKVSPGLRLPPSSPSGSGCLSLEGDGLPPANSVPSFVLCMVLAVSYVRAIPQSGLLAQVSSLRLPSGHSILVLTLSNGACASLPSHRLLVAGAGVCAASPLGCYLWARNLWVLIIYLFFLPVMLPPVLPRLTTDSAVRVFLGVWKLLSFLRLPSWDRAPSLPLLSLFLSFIFFPTSF